MPLATFVLLARTQSTRSSDSLEGHCQQQPRHGAATAADCPNANERNSLLLLAIMMGASCGGNPELGVNGPNATSSVAGCPLKPDPHYEVGHDTAFQDSCLS